MGTPGPWTVARARGSAGELHERRPWDGAAARRVWLCDCLGPAVVLGSVQPEGHVDAGRALAGGFKVVRRHSGGGAVLVLPGETVWVDVAIPRGDPLWDLDVGRAFVWLGRAWARALDSLGLGPADVHEGAMVRSAWSGHMCFAGLGPGEVSVAGRKVVGLSQRRSREGAVFSCAAYLSHDPGVLPALLALDDGARLQASAALGAMAAPLGAMSCGPQRGPAGCDEVEKALLAAMVQGGPGLAWALAG